MKAYEVEITRQKLIPPWTQLEAHTAARVAAVLSGAAAVGSGVTVENSLSAVIQLWADMYDSWAGG